MAKSKKSNTGFYQLTKSIMAKKRSQPNHWLTVVSIAIIIAALLGIAYLADNTTGSSAQQSYSSIATPTNSSGGSILPRSPYPACQELLDHANQAIVGDYEYQSYYAALAALIKERDYWNNILYNDRNATEADKRNARLHLMQLAPKIIEAQEKLAKRRSEIFAEYDACVARERAKIKPWWQRLFPNSANSSPSQQTSTPTARTSR